MKPRSKLVSHAIALACLALGLSAASLAHAENHALIMWIGDYGSPGRNDLPGIDEDARLAKGIAVRLGVPVGNIREVSNAALTHLAIGQELARLNSRVREGDNVFVYFSGHGQQISKIDGSGCTEGLVPRDTGNLFRDEDLSAALKKLSSKAGQVVMLNDSCYSGGAATKSLGTAEEFRPKVFEPPEENKAIAYQCGAAVNKGLSGVFSGSSARGENMLYVAASAFNEVAYPSNRGSIATLAWSQCLSDSATDTNRSGSIDGVELATCANGVIQRIGRKPQTVSLVGNRGLPLVFSTQSGSANSISVRSAFEDVRGAASPGIKLSLSANAQRLRIGKDFLDFTVTTSEAGYLYLLHAGSDGKTYDLLLPNQIDRENYVQAGTHRFPRASWQMQAGGPAGTSHIMAVLSKTQRKFDGFMQYKGPIADAPVDESMARNIVISSTGSGGGKYGASNILSLQEY